MGKIRWRRDRLPTLVFLPRKSHGQRSLVGYRIWGRKELTTWGETAAPVSLGATGDSAPFSNFLVGKLGSLVAPSRRQKLTRDRMLRSGANPAPRG